MDAKDFHKELLENVKTTAAADGSGSNDAFVNLMAEYLIDAEILLEYNVAYFCGKGKRQRNIRVDGYSYDELDNTMNMIISDYSGEEKRKDITASEAKEIFQQLIYFIDEVYESNKFNEKIEESTPAADLVDLLLQKKDEIKRFRLFLFIDGFMSGRIKELNNEKYKELPTNAPIECQIWDTERVFRNCLENTEDQEIEINFKDFTEGTGISCLKASQTSSENYRSYLGIVPGKLLADIYRQYGAKLLEGNVRSFLSTKVTANKNIRTTILSCPENFFAYNNGISVTAKDLKFDERKEGIFLTYAKDFQVINGGQTTASLLNAEIKDKADLSKIFVQMKLTEIDADLEKSSEIIKNISRSSNTQSKVSDADFFSSHPFHIRMEQISRRIYAPAVGGTQYETKWFYERARGQYLQAQMKFTKTQKTRFELEYPKKQLISKTDMAKYRNSWDMIPNEVSKGAQTNFIEYAEIVSANWERADEDFNEQYFKDSVALALLFKRTEELVSRQPWYLNGYRANIVTYSIALLHKLIILQFPEQDLDLQIIWNRQDIPDIIEDELIKITKYVNDIITNEDRETINVTQWCKRLNCWKKVQKDCSIELSTTISKVLLSKHKKKNVAKEAKKDQKIISGFEAQEKIILVTSNTWERVEKFADEKHLRVSENQIKALKIAKKIPMKLPNAFQAVVLLNLLEDAKNNGFKI